MDKIIITGCGRSGTSICAGLFRKTELYKGQKHLPPNSSNIYGYFEDEEVNHINDHILRKQLYLEVNFYIAKFKIKIQPFPRKLHSRLWLFAPYVTPVKGISENFRNKIQRITADSFCLKDPRFVYTYKIWIDNSTAPQEDIGIIYVFRHPDNTVESMIKEIETTTNISNIRIKLYSYLYRFWYITNLTASNLISQHKGPHIVTNLMDSNIQTQVMRIEEWAEKNLDHKFPKSNSITNSRSLVPHNNKWRSKSLELYDKLYNTHITNNNKLIALP